MHRPLRTCLVGIVSMALLSGLAGGCTTTDEEAPEAAKTPHLLALSTYSASLGTPVDAFMANPPSSTAKKIELVFEGSFKRSDGRVENVSMTQPTNRTEAGAVRWTTFGPFANPFSPTDPDIGTFTGTVGVKVTEQDGTITMDEKPIPVSFEVRPSIIVTELQPLTAECNKPALRLIGGMAYKLKTKTIGFKPASIDYSFQTPGVIPNRLGKPTLDVDTDGQPRYQTRSLSHTMAATEDAIGEDEALILPPMPIDVPNYGVVFAMTATDDKGRKISNVFGMTAHNPLEFYNDNRFELAQIYPAVPVSSCIPGGQQGRSVNYTESNTETRSRTVSLTLSKSWLKSEENNWSTSDGKTVTRSSTVTDGYSNTRATANTLSFTQMQSNTNTVSFGWSDSTTNQVGGKVGGEINLGVGPASIGKIGAEVNGSHAQTSGTNGGTSSSSTSGWTQGNSTTTSESNTVDHSTSTTDSTAVTTTDTKGGSVGEQEGTGEALTDSWTVSSADTISRGFAASVIAGTYGVFYRQMARYTHRVFVVVYDKCGEGDVVGDLTMQDYVWAPDLALGEACPPFPVSNFPQPQCYLPPCDP